MNISNGGTGDERLPSLPEGWVWVSVANITKPVQKNDPSQKPHQEFMYLDISSVDNKAYKIFEPKKYKGSNAPSRARQLVRADDVLISTVRTYLRNIAQVPKKYDGQIASTGFAVLRAEEGVVPQYLFYFCLSDGFILSLDELQRGTSYPAVRDSDIREQFISIAPLAEQQRIVASIQERLSQIDDGVTMLRRAQRRLKRYREAVLKAASEGKLVAQALADEPALELLRRVLDERRAKWEADQIAKMQAQGRMTLDDEWKAQYVEPAPPNTKELPELPEGWVWVTLSQLGELARGKSKHRPRNDVRLFGGPYPFVQTGEIRLAKNTLTAYTQTYSEFGLAQSRLWPAGTLCITIAANIAETALLGIDACFPDSIVGLIADELICNIRFVEYFIRIAKENLEHYAPATAQKNINLDILEKLAIPLPPIAEQQRIVAEVERRLSIADNVEVTIELNLKRADVLRQTVLKQAFAGKLVPQNPADEPANVLLQRITEARATREADLQATREAEAKQPKTRGIRVKANKSNARRPLYDVLTEANRRLTPKELFDQAGFTIEFIEEFYDELRREAGNRIKVARPNNIDVYMEVASNEA